MIKSKKNQDNFNICLNTSDNNYNNYNNNNGNGNKYHHRHKNHNQFISEKNNFELKEDIERLLIENDYSLVQNSEISSFLNN